MNRILLAFFSIFVVVLSPLSALRAEEPYLYDLLEQPELRQAWDALLAGEKKVPQWLVKYAATTNGPSRPSWTVASGKTGYRVSWVCKAHDCGDNQFYVLFAENGKKAWGLLLEAEKPDRFFGSPSDAQKRLLRDATRHEE